MAKRRAVAKTLTNRTCKQITALVLDYLNGNLSPNVKSDFEKHLRICPDCVSFLKTYEKTVQTTRSINAETMPPRVRNNILTFLRKRIHRVGGYSLILFAPLIGASSLLASLFTRCVDLIVPHF